MTRKDYVLIASALKANRDKWVVTPTWLDAVYSVADALKADNARFDRARFLAACGVSP